MGKRSQWHTHGKAALSEHRLRPTRFCGETVQSELEANSSLESCCAS